MRRILLVTAAIAALAAAAVWFAAEESYVTTVKATVGTGLRVDAHGSQNYGLVFPQEVRRGAMLVEINAKAKADRNLTGIRFTVGCNGVRVDTKNNLSSVCDSRILTIQGKGQNTLCVLDPNGIPVDPFCDGTSQSQQIRWEFNAPDCQDAAQKKPADVFTLPCSQDKNWNLAGAIFVDVNEYIGVEKDSICNKKGNILVDGQTGEPKLIDGEFIPCVVENGDPG